MIENHVQTSVFNLLTNSMSVNGQVYEPIGILGFVNISSAKKP